MTPISSGWQRVAAACLAGLAMAHGMPIARGENAPDPTATDAAGIEYFESHIRPLLVEHCYECHSEESGESQGGLRLDNAASIQRGGLTGPAVDIREVESSLLVKAVRYDDPNLQMPPTGKLDDELIRKLEHWISIGAPDPRQGSASESNSSPQDRDPKTHWAFQLPKRTVPPQASTDGLDRDSIDTHARVAALEKGLAVNPIADDATLIRRLYFDLSGLSPTQEQVQEYAESKQLDKYQRMVDELLASPEFGERFGRHWLDVARYADTVGYALAGKERRFKGSERYRDWTIAAMAGDMPYDQMIHHQLAGDRTDPENKMGNLDAMGFLTLGRRFLSDVDTDDDRIDVITRGLLGLTVSCSRCHDHKFDPIPTTDYYSLFGVLRSSKIPEDGPSPLMMIDQEKPYDERVFIRGQSGNRGDVAPRQFLTALRRPDEQRFSDGSGRLELARRITDSDNPLTARVMVNRLWQILVGSSLVETPSDFGFRTQPPAIPAVLDDLASDFSNHWSIKRTVRRIVTTKIYQQSSDVNEDSFALDPQNQYLTRSSRRRRDFESLRDSMLQCAGMLDRQMGGQSVEISGLSVASRRTVYAMIDRQDLPALFRTFDFASPDIHSPGRYQTTVPQQSLFLLNHPQTYELATKIADSIRQESGGNMDRQTDLMFQRVLGRRPTSEEMDQTRAFLQTPVAAFVGPIDPRSLWSYGYSNLSENQHRPTDFHPFELFRDNRHQHAEKFPAENEFGYASITTGGGHTANDTSKAVVRRFTAPVAGKVTVREDFGHQSDQGDGVHFALWMGDRRIHDDIQKAARANRGPKTYSMKAGETLDFIAYCGRDSSFDSFDWKIKVVLQMPDGRTLSTESDKDFADTQSIEKKHRGLDRLSQLAQVLLMSNEFAFID
jgi:Protein of unknown function (DUF1553)/Protein of unknown function (DUF1549)/Planctomycete cytochrome C